MRRLLKPSFCRSSAERIRVNASFKPVFTMPTRAFSSDVPKDFTSVTSPSADPSSLSAATNILSTDPSLIDAATSAAAVAVASTENVNFVVKGVMTLIDNVHTMIGVPYWEAIVLTTIGLRIVLLPVVLKTTQGSARMAVMRPDMLKVQQAMEKDPNIDDMKVKLRYQNEMKALFVKHKVNPLRAMMWPIFQFPVFIAFFMGLKDMGTYYPGFKEGGDFWFTDLSAPDVLYALPVLNSLSFLMMIEMGADGMPTQQQAMFKNIMRGLAVVLVPLTSSMPQGLFVYWVTNNFLSVIQTLVVKNESVRQALDIPKAPVDNSPNIKLVNPLTAISKIIEEEKSKGENAKAEILRGVATKSDKAPPVVFDRRPTKKTS